MFYFVEFLRAKRAMRVVLIILGILTLAVAGFRIYMVGAHGADEIVSSLEHSPTAHVTSKTLAGGTLETTVDDPAQSTHAVIRTRGKEIHITVSEPMKRYDEQTNHLVYMGSDHEDVTVKGSLGRASMDFKPGGHDFDLAGLFGAAGIMALVAATMLAAPLAKENDGHLDIAWTKPVSRDGYALSAFAIDSAAIVLSQILTVAVIFLWSLMFIVPAVTLGSGLALVLMIVMPIAWYAMLTAFSTSLKRGPGLILGLGWPAALIVSGLAQGTRDAHSPFVHGIHVVFQALAYIDPLAYADFSNGDWHGNGVITTIPLTVLVLCLLAVLYLASAVLQWRRVEA